ncbi:MAG: EutN/CcmL family microcompartment protein [Elusimicrobiota bacterium]
MEFGIITGTVVCTAKDAGISGAKLLMVQPVDDELKAASTPLVGIDSVGAGEGELVLFVKGSSARMTEATDNRPVDCTIIAIVDNIEKNGKTIFTKYGD